MGKAVRRGYHAIRRSTEVNTKKLALILAVRFKQQGYKTRIYRTFGGYRVTGVQEGAKKRR